MVQLHPLLLDEQAGLPCPITSLGEKDPGSGWSKLPTNNNLSE